MKLAATLIGRAARRDPDQLIGADNTPTHLSRRYLLPRNRFFNVYLHHFGRCDHDRAHHTHLWAFNVSLLLRGMLVEHVIERGGLVRKHVLLPGSLRFRWGASPHRLELPHGWTAWTLFITGPRVREWDFLCGERLRALGALHGAGPAGRDRPGVRCMTRAIYAAHMTQRRAA